MDNFNLKTVVQSIELKNFRCFKDNQFNIDAPLVIIEGKNGTGKTSFIEALYFAGHVRSCKTAYVENLITQNEQAFFLKICLNEHNVLYIGAEQNKRIIKINQKNVKFLAELREYINVISIVDTDLQVIQGGPAERRLFLDEALLLLHNNLAGVFKKLKVVVKNRNDFLSKRIQNPTLYDVLSEQLFECSLQIQQKRLALLEELSINLNSLIADFNLPLGTISLAYNPKIDFTQKKLAFENIKNYKNKEYLQGRSLFGAHLDDFAIFCESLDTRKQSSRGQQKLMLILLKITLVLLCNKEKNNLLFLIDDFITDLDETNIKLIMIMLCSLQCQLIFTTPLALFLQKHVPVNLTPFVVNL